MKCIMWCVGKTLCTLLLFFFVVQIETFTENTAVLSLDRSHKLTVFAVGYFLNTPRMRFNNLFDKLYTVRFNERLEIFNVLFAWTYLKLEAKSP